MSFSHTLAEDLDALTEALGDPVLDLEAVLSVLTDDLTSAVPGYLGFSMTLYRDGTPITMTSLVTTTAAGACASLWLPLAPLGALRPDGHMIFYASAIGAFDDLTADARWMFNLNGAVVVDGHLLPINSPIQPGFQGLEEFSEINQALGTLIATGLTASDARIELDRRACQDQRTVLDTARGLLSTVTERPASAQ